MKFQLENCLQKSIFISYNLYTISKFLFNSKYLSIIYYSKLYLIHIVQYKNVYKFIFNNKRVDLNKLYCIYLMYNSVQHFTYYLYK